MLVKNRITKEPLVVPPNTSIGEAIRTMRENRDAVDGSAKGFPRSAHRFLDADEGRVSGVAGFSPYH